MAQMAEDYRTEKDALGEVRVPADRLWGAQTERSRENFPIGVDRYRWGRPVIRALGVLKKARLAGLEPVDVYSRRVGPCKELTVRRQPRVRYGAIRRVGSDPPHFRYPRRTGSAFVPPGDVPQPSSRSSSGSHKRGNTGSAAGASGRVIR